MRYQWHDEQGKKFYVHFPIYFFHVQRIKHYCMVCNSKNICDRRLLRDHLNVSRIMVKRTNLPRRGTTSEVGGMISANSKKNTVRESKILMERLTWKFLVLLLTFYFRYYWNRFLNIYLKVLKFYEICISEKYLPFHHYHLEDKRQEL